jgi:hypothetical protein
LLILSRYGTTETLRSAFFLFLRKAWGLFSYILLSSLTNLIHLVMISVTGSDTDVRCYKSDSRNTDIEPGFVKIDTFSFSEKRIIISAIVTLFTGLVFGRFLYGSFRQSYFNELKFLVLFSFNLKPNRLQIKIYWFD